MAGRKTSGGGEFLALLFYGLFRAASSAKDASNRASTDRIMAEQRRKNESERDAFRNLDGYLFDKSLDAEINTYIEAEYRYRSFDEKLDRVLRGVRYKNEQVNSSFFLKNQKELMPIIKILLTAQRGKVPKNIAEFGFTPSIDYAYGDHDKWYLTHQCMLVADRLLRSHGVEPMLFLPKSQRNKDKAQPISEIRQPVYGTYFWKSGSYFIF